MYRCSFEVNDQLMSEFVISGCPFPAFSGIGTYINRSDTVCLTHFGAISQGTYYIVD